MKRLPILILLLLIANYYLLITPAFGQERIFNFDRAFSDYTYTLGQYRQAHADYVVARQAYLNYKTLTSKNEAFDQALKMLELRDAVVQTYLTVLRMKLAETTGISNYEQNILYIKLDDDIGWHLDHKDTLSSSGSLEDLVETSEKAQRKYANTEILIYQALQTILGGKEASLREEINQQVEALKRKLVEIRLKGDKEVTLPERWLLEAENRLTRSHEKQLASEEILGKMRPYDQNKSRIYNQSQYALEESHQYLKEANFYLQELIREVKRAD